MLMSILFMVVVGWAQSKQTKKQINLVIDANMWTWSLWK